MIRQTAILLSAAFLMGLPAAAHADAMKKEGGNLDLAPDLAWAQPLKDSEMAEVRGGMGGMSFSVFFTGSVTDLVVDPGDPVSTSDVTVSTGTVNISDFIASSQNINGVFQFTTVNGSMNVVNNHMTIQVALFPSGTPVVPTTTIFGVPGGS